MKLPDFAEGRAAELGKLVRAVYGRSGAHRQSLLKRFDGKAFVIVGVNSGKNQEVAQEGHQGGDAAMESAFWDALAAKLRSPASARSKLAHVCTCSTAKV